MKDREEEKKKAIAIEKWMEEIDKDENCTPINEATTYILNPAIPDVIERKAMYSTVVIEMYKHQRDFVNSMQRFLGFPSKSGFMRHAILSFCVEQKRIHDIKLQADEEFKTAYIKWRKKFFIKKMKIKERVEELKRMAPPQDDGEDDPFSEEELMD